MADEQQKQPFGSAQSPLSTAESGDAVVPAPTSPPSPKPALKPFGKVNAKPANPSHMAEAAPATTSSPTAEAGAVVSFEKDASQEDAALQAVLSAESLPTFGQPNTIQQENIPSNSGAKEVDGQDQTALYKRALEILKTANDLGVSGAAQTQIEQYMTAGDVPQLVVKKLLSSRVINRIQFARATARAQHRMEILSFIELPQDALSIRKDLSPAVINLLRDNRVVPVFYQIVEQNGEAKTHKPNILGLANETATADVLLESALAQALPNTIFRWHFILRDVAGAYWLSGESHDVDEGMEAEALLDRVIGNAIDARSSDIHIDPSIRGEQRAIVKYRIDGSVTPKEVITLEQLDRLRVRIENLARMPKVNHVHPNKGAFTRAGYDWRVQIQPHTGPFGTVPRIVLRQLKPDVLPMETLGYPEYFIEQIKSGAQASNGVVFWTGPTGSGKTESIHSAIVSVNPMAKGLSVHTIEDPPEKRVPGYALQMEAVDDDPKRTALQLLKSSLRADPDIIVIGEVRDKEMAKLAFEAANTGHLVFTTLHTNTAIDALSRLYELDVQGFLLSYIRGIAAQRLVRRLCVHCRQKVEEPDEYTRYVFDRYGLEMEGANLYKSNPQGCPSCNFHGYYGRIAVAEWLVPSKEIIELSAKADFENVEDAARRAGWQPMGYMGCLHVKNGITDAEELARKILELSGDLI